jgi:phage-related minor tail protein
MEEEVGSGPRAESERMANAARQLALETRHLEVPSDSRTILGNLVATQRSIEQAIRQLAEWHRSARAERHYSPDHDESTVGIMTAVSELDLAAQQAEGLQETLARALGGNSVVLWLDEIDSSEED